VTKETFAGLRAYLLKLNYAEQTARQTVHRAKHVAELQAAGKLPLLPGTWRSALLHLAAAGDAGELPAPIADHAKALLDVQKSARLPYGLRGGRKPKGRKKTARSVSDEAWPKLLAAFAAPGTEDAGPRAVLHLEATTALRIGDILRLTRDELAGAQHGTVELVQKGGGKRTLYVDGAIAAWTQLATYCAAFPKKGHPNVAACLSSSDDASASGAAYKQCARYLKRLQLELGLDRLHTHRLRRTMAVQTARMTNDITVVGQMLGQVPGSRATFEYVDEARPERVAEVAKRVRERFGGGS
jgi:integrase